MSARFPLIVLALVLGLLVGVVLYRSDLPFHRFTAQLGSPCSADTLYAANGQGIFGFLGGSWVQLTQGSVPYAALYVQNGSVFATYRLSSTPVQYAVMRCGSDQTWHDIGVIPGGDGTMAPFQGQLYINGNRIKRYSNLTDGFVDFGVQPGTSSESLIGFNGLLYTGVVTRFPTTGNTGVQIQSYDGAALWTAVSGELPGLSHVRSMVVSNGKLFVAGGFPGMKVYRYEGGMTWTDVSVGFNSPSYGIGPMIDVAGQLFAGTVGTSANGGHVYVFNGTSWTDQGVLGWQVNTFNISPLGLLAGVGTTVGNSTIYRENGGAWIPNDQLGNSVTGLVYLSSVVLSSSAAPSSAGSSASTSSAGASTASSAQSVSSASVSSSAPSSLPPAYCCNPTTDQCILAP